MPLHAADASGNAALTSDHVFRGISQSNDGHLTDHNARVLFGDLAGPRLEASLQASF